MWDLLGDNIALLQQLDSVQDPFQSFSGGPKPHLRDITSLSSWLHCFLAYTAIRTTDQDTRDQLTYTGSSSRNLCETVPMGGSTMIVSFGSRWLSTLLFPGILSTHQPSLVRGLGQCHSALSALGRITLRVSVPCSHSSHPHHRHNHPGLDQSDCASPVHPEDLSHCSTFVCPGTKGHVSNLEHAPTNTYVPPANSGIGTPSGYPDP